MTALQNCIEAPVHVLGLKKIYLQSKKYSGQTVPYGDVAQFFGKCTHDEVPGIFITTSSFSNQTIDEFKNNTSSIKLISGIEFVKKFDPERWDYYRVAL